jgi:hypothetical protein
LKATLTWRKQLAFLFELKKSTPAGSIYWELRMRERERQTERERESGRADEKETGNGL